MREKIRKYSQIIILPLLLLGCNESINDSVSLGYEYFPLNTGDYRVYDVVRIDHNIDLTSDTTTYQLKEVIGETYLTGNEESYRLERYSRKNEGEVWAIDSVWSARRNSYNAIVVENNVPVIKLSFPVEEDRRWDGNSMNSRDYDEFKMINIGASFIMPEDQTMFGSAVTLVKEDALDPAKIASDDYRIEVFGKNIGMIYRIDLYRKYCGTTGQGCEQGTIEFGTEIEYSIIDYSIND